MEALRPKIPTKSNSQPSDQPLDLDHALPLVDTPNSTNQERKNGRCPGSYFQAPEVRR